MSKRNRPRPTILPPSDSTRPDADVRAPAPMLTAREPDPLAAAVVATDPNARVICRWAPAYPCPGCYSGLGGIGVVHTTLSTIVYCACNKCGRRFSSLRRMDAQPINCVPMVPVPETRS